MRKIPVLLAAGLGLLLAAAAAAELLFGGWLVDEPLDRLGLVRDSDLVVSGVPAPADGGAFVLHRDHWGFRGAGIDPARIDVLTVGGDTTAQTALPDDATWQAVMEADLRAAGRDVTVANAGVDGLGSLGHLRAMAEWFPRVPGLRPHFVLFSVGLEEGLADGGLPPPPHLTTAGLFRRHSVLWRLAVRLLPGLTPPPASAGEIRTVDFAAARWTDVPAQPDLPLAVDAYKDRLRRLAQDSHAMGAVPVFVTATRADFRLVDGKVQGIAAAGGPNGIDHYRRLAAVNRATRELCADEGLLCLDLAREVTFEPGDFYDYLHNTPQGAARIGHWLAGKLAGLV